MGMPGGGVNESLCSACSKRCKSRKIFKSELCIAKRLVLRREVSIAAREVLGRLRSELRRLYRRDDSSGGVFSLGSERTVIG